MYVGDGNIVHNYPGIRGKNSSTVEQVVRKHKIDTLVNFHGGRDLLAYRPKVSPGERREAAEAALGSLGTPYNYWEGLRAAFLPAGAEEDEAPDLKAAAICTRLIADAYSGIKFSRKRSRRHLMARDFMRSGKMVPVGALSRSAE